MCSCYVASRNSDCKEEESRRTGDDPPPENRRHSITSSENIEDGRFIMVGSDESRIVVDRNRNKSINASSSNYGLQVDTCSTVPLKSSLKRSASVVEMSSSKINQGLKKVSWSDAHGKDIAHVHEFEPSEEGELRGVGNSCICAIQ